MLPFCNDFDLHSAIIGIENQFMVFYLSGRLRQVLLYLPQNKSYMPSMFHHVGEAVHLCTGQLYGWCTLVG